MTFNVPTPFNSADKGAAVVLSADLRSISLPVTTAGSARSFTKTSTGKWYVEFTRSAGGTGAYWMFGLGSSTMSLTQYPGQSNQGIALYRGSVYLNAVVVATVAALDTTGVFGVEIDATARTVRFFNASGTTAALSFPWSGDVYLVGGGDNSAPSGNLTINAGQAAFTYSVPSGFTSGFVLRTVYGIAGNVDDAAGANAARTLMGINRSTGVMTCTTVSDASTGDYLLVPEPNNTNAHVVLALPVSTSENALVLDRMVPA